VERLFPFARKSGALVVGRDSLYRFHRKLHFLLLTTDLSGSSRERFERDFADVTIVTAYTSDDLQKYFQFFGTKVLGFKKSPLSVTILRELRNAGKFHVTRPQAKLETRSQRGPVDESVTDQAGTDSDMSDV
jgi:hypothetical protein